MTSTGCKAKSPEGKGRPKREANYFYIIPPGNCCNSRRGEAGTEQTAPESGWGWGGGDWELKEYLWNDQE